MQESNPSDALGETEENSALAVAQAIQRFHQLMVYTRWLVVAALWLTVGSFSLWGLRYPISLLQQYFTWSAVRYGLAYHPIAAVGLGLCVGMTVAVLIWQSRNILVGLPKREQERLQRQVIRIREQGPSHPLWRFVYEK